MWEGCLPSMVVGQEQMYQLTLPHRGQAPSHIFDSVSSVGVHEHKPRHMAGVCDASLQPYFNLAIAAFSVLLGRMALLVSSGFGA